MIDKLDGRRKFYAAIAAMACVEINMLAGVMDGDQFNAIVPWILGLFVGGNVGEYLSKRVP